MSVPGVPLYEPCKRCGRTVFGALTDENVGVYLDADQPVVLRNFMPFAAPQQKRHVCPKEKP